MTKEEINNLAESIYNVFFLSGGENNMIVPVIGDELILYDNVSVREYIIDKISITDKTISEEQKNLFSNGGYYGLSKLTEKKLWNGYKHEMLRLARSLELNIDDEVKKFLVNCKFPLIVSTSPFPLIETILGRNKCETVWYTKDMYENTTQSVLQELINKAPKKTIVVHIFGNAIVDDCVDGERTLLSYLYRLSAFSQTQGSPANELAKMLQSKLLMVLGCDLPNWIFRFLWQSMYYKEDFKTVYWFNDDKLDESFLDFMQELKFMRSGVKNDGIEVFKKINEFFKCEGEKVEYKYDFFISHCGDESDTQKSRKIKEILEQQKVSVDGVVRNIKVWIDKTEDENNTSGTYQEKWEVAIKHSRFFMPIVTQKYIIRLQTCEINERRDNEDGLVLETRTAVEYGDKRKDFFVPVVADACLNPKDVEKYTNGEKQLLRPIFRGCDMRSFADEEKDKVESDIRNEKWWQGYFDRTK